MSGILSIAIIFALGIGAQWVAWRYRVPSILLLLVLGFLAGPVTGLLDPLFRQEDWVFTFVAISVGVILFESSLNLRLAELREVGAAVVRLITVGVLITWVLGALAAYHLIGFNVSISILMGALLTVTGPTVIIPLLSHVRPKGRVGTIAKWEGITIDPIGAILAVLVLESILLVHEPGAGSFREAVFNAIEGLMLEFVIGLGVGICGAAVLIVLMRQRLVPDFLHNSVALTVVISTFAVSDTLLHESGLVAATVMGVFVANQKQVVVRRIAEFKEDLRVLLLAVLFIVLAAGLNLADLKQIGVGTVGFLLVLMLVVRPISVFLSTVGTRLNWKEQAFLSWLAPRGVVAAAVASLFSFRLESLFPAQSEALVPVVFLVIVGTVAIYGLTISPLANWLGLADPNPQGVLFAGAHHWAREMAREVSEQGFKVLLVDSNPENVYRARQDGLPAVHANILSEDIMDQLDLNGIGRLLAVTQNDEVNSLAVLHFRQVFDSSEIYQLATGEEWTGKNGHERVAQHLRGRPLFDADSDFRSLSDRFLEGAQIEAFELTETFSFEDYERSLGGRATPLFVIKGPHQLQIVSRGDGFQEPEAGSMVVALVDPVPETVASTTTGNQSEPA